jgi:acetolactate synthase I/II/III large subunit
MVATWHKLPNPAEPLKKRMTVHRAADVLIDTLAKAGVKVIFGIPGGALVALNDALIDRPDIRVITTRHESGAMFAAAAYARMTESIGVVMVTSGPGVLNTMTGLASAYCDGLPVLVIAGEVPRALFGKGALQEGSANHLNIVGMAKHITKLAIEITDPNSAPAVFGRAIATATSGRPGPVLVSVPLDVTTATISRPGISSEVELSCVLQSGLIGKVARTLESARRPLIFAGSGTRWGHAPERLRQLAERLQIPVMTTPKAKGVFPESHPLSLGVFGHGGHPSAAEYVEERVDVLLAVGTGLSDPATNGWSPALQPSEHLIQIDVDALKIGKNYPVSVGIVGPAEAVLEKIVDATHIGPRVSRRFGVRRYSDPSTVSPGASALAPQRALWELQQILPADTIYTCDIGEHLLFTTHYLEINDPDGFVIMTGLASMGSSIAAALGTKIARPDRPAAAICGDGCFAMALGDLATAVRERVPLLVAVLNDRRYGMVELGHLAIYGRTPSYSCGELSISDLAAGVGAEVQVIESAGQILDLDIEQRLTRGPMVLDVRIDPTSRMPKNKRFQDLGRVVGNSHDGE